MRSAAAIIVNPKSSYFFRHLGDFSDLLECEPDFMTNCSFSMIPADDDGCDLDSLNLELKSEPLAVGDNSSISDRAHNDSQVSKEQSHDNVPASAVENKTCCDPIPSVSSSGAPSTYGVNYQVGTEGCSRSEEMLPENGNCAIPGDGG